MKLIQTKEKVVLKKKQGGFFQHGNVQLMYHKQKAELIYEYTSASVGLT